MEDLAQVKALVAHLEQNNPKSGTEGLHERELGVFQGMLDRLFRGQTTLTLPQRKWVADALERYDVDWESPPVSNENVPIGKPVAPLWDHKHLPKKPPGKR